MHSTFSGTRHILNMQPSRYVESGDDVEGNLGPEGIVVEVTMSQLMRPSAETNCYAVACGLHVPSISRDRELNSQTGVALTRITTLKIRILYFCFGFSISTRRGFNIFLSDKNLIPKTMINSHINISHYERRRAISNQIFGACYLR